MELNKLDTNFKNNTNQSYYEDIILKDSDYDSNLKKNVLIKAVDFSIYSLIDWLFFIGGRILQLISFLLRSQY